MEYVNPGAAFSKGLSDYLLDRAARDRQEKMDAIAQQKEQLAQQHEQVMMQEHQAAAQQAGKDRFVRDVEARQARLMPGDVADADLMADSVKAHRPLPVKIQPSEGVWDGGADDNSQYVPGPDQNIYLGTPQYRMGQMKADADKATAMKLQEARIAAAHEPDPRKALEILTMAGEDPTKAKTLISSVPEEKSTEDIPIMRINPRTGKVEQIGTAPKNTHFTTEPAPINVNVGGENSEFTHDALTKMAEAALEGAPDPAFGADRGGQMHKAYGNILAQMQTEQGVSGAELARRRLRYKAEQGSANNLQKNFDTTEAFSEKAQADLKNFDAVLDQIPDHDIRILNRLDRGAAREGLKGTAVADAMAAFDVYGGNTATEYAKIIANANGGVLTDSARQETKMLVNPDATKSQLRAAFHALVQEAQNRHTSYSDRLGTLYTPRSGGGSSIAPADAKPTPEDLYKKYSTGVK